MTKGEYRVGITFNPSNDDTVGKIKRAAADLIDLIEGILIDLIEGIEQPRIDGDMTTERWVNVSTHLKEVKRLQELAQTAIEDGAMWAVKAATKGPKA